MAGSVYAAIGFIRRGIWDYYTKPGMKSYLIYSAAAGLLFGISLPLIGFFRYGASPMVSLLHFAGYFLFFFAIMFSLCWILGTATKKRQERLAQELDKE